MGRYSWQLRRQAAFETLESRNLLAADPLPVLMVLADRQDFYYREYGETRFGLEAAGNSGAAWLFMVATDCQYWLTQAELVTSQ